MAEHILKSYSCDRCNADLGNEKPKEDIVVNAQKNGEWALDFDAKWKHLCPGCRQVVVEFFTRSVT